MLESGFDIDTGKSLQGGRLFGRQAFVGIQSGWGSVLLGRQNTSLYDYVGNYDPLALAPRYGVVTQDTSFTARADNSIKYVGGFGGLKVSAFYSAGADSSVANGSEVPGAPKLGRGFGSYVTYDSGPLSVGVAYDEVNTGTTTLNPDATARRFSGAGSYVVGSVKLFGGYRWARGYHGGVIPGSIAGASNQGGNLYWTGVNWQATPALALAAAAYYQDFKNTGNDPWLFTLNADYAFSKRTRAYASLGYIKNKGTSNLGFYDNGKTFGNTNPGQNQFGVTIGLRQVF